MLVAGVGLCIDQCGAQSDLSLLGVPVAFAGVASAGVMLACSSAVMAADSVDPVALTCFSAPWSAAALAPFALVMEVPRYGHVVATSDGSSGLAGVALAIVASCAAASTYNMCANSLLRQTSPVWMTVFGQARLLVLLVVAAFTLPGERVESGDEESGGRARGKSGPADGRSHPILQASASFFRGAPRPDARWCWRACACTRTRPRLRSAPNRTTWWVGVGARGAGDGAGDGAPSGAVP